MNWSKKLLPRGYVYIKVKIGMYGLKEAEVWSYNQLSTLTKNIATLTFLVLLEYGLTSHNKLSSVYVLMILLSNPRMKKI